MSGRTPRDLCNAIEGGEAPLPRGPYPEAFSGYGVMGLPFSSGHVLALRRFPINSLGGPYTSVWHRDPSGRWTFRQDVADELACSRYFGVALGRSIPGQLALTWPSPSTIDISGEGLQWRVELAATPTTRAMNALSSLLPSRAWDSPIVLGVMERAAGAAMRVGRVGLKGTVPNGQRFTANPVKVWMVSGSSATVDGEDLGPPGPLAEQAQLGDFRVPQRGVFAIGRSFFEEFDPTRHRGAYGT